MYINVEPFGLSVYGEVLGSTWLSLVESIIKNGDETVDEGRKRLSLQNLRVRSVTQHYPDIFIGRYADQENVKQVIELTFNNEVMYDFDVVPSFSKGSKSYWARIKEGEMLEYIVQRLSAIPESKKAVMSFINWDDYKAVLKNPKDDYLPCITSIQFRLLSIEKSDGYYMNTIFNARSIDAYQKAPGNFAAIALLSKEIARRLQQNLSKPILIGSLDGFIADAHIYNENMLEARTVIQQYKKYEHNGSSKTRE